MIENKLEKYIEEHTSNEEPLLKELNRETNAKILWSRMISGHVQGKALEMISHMIKPLYILELGTFTGYSALCLVKGLSENGKLITIDINDELEGFTRSFFNRSSFAEKIDYRIGNAMDIIPNLDVTFDLVFIDADKENYLNYYEMVLPKVRSGGFIVADNVLWDGKVILPKISENDIATKKIVEFNAHIQNDSRVENVIFAIRDGLMVMRKL